jgi:uncharacterized protein (DUF305 family)
MIDHHAGGAEMAQAAAAAADDEWVTDTAAKMATIQALEINEMELTRDRVGLPADPPGFTADFVTHEMDGTGEDDDS